MPEQYHDTITTQLEAGLVEDDELIHLFVAWKITELIEEGRKNRDFYIDETRRVLEAVRDRTTSDDERAYIAEAIKAIAGVPGTEKIDHERQMYVLALRYLDTRSLTCREIARLVNCNVRTIFRDIEAGIKRLAFWLFGLPALDLQ